MRSLPGESQSERHAPYSAPEASTPGGGAVLEPKMRLDANACLPAHRQQLAHQDFSFRTRNENPLIHRKIEVAELRESKSRPEAGIVTFIHRAYNQRGELVAQCKRSGLQRKRTAA